MENASPIRFKTIRFLDNNILIEFMLIKKMNLNLSSSWQTQNNLGCFGVLLK
jgi:hypothetical protein